MRDVNYHNTKKITDHSLISNKRRSMDESGHKIRYKVPHIQQTMTVNKKDLVSRILKPLDQILLGKDQDFNN